MILASAISMPLSQVLFSVRPIVTDSYMPYHVTDGVALVLTFVGFACYQLFSPEGRAARAVAPPKYESIFEDDNEGISEKRPLLQ